ncbi:MAG: hypothetical protein AAFN94_01590 [Pseudomonadota bacterium]
MAQHRPGLLQRCLTTFGVIIGIVGILHGSAEVLKGAVLVETRSVEALPIGWPNDAFYAMTRGSPVFSILTGIPFFALGLLAITMSIAMIVLCLTVIRVDRFGLVLFFLLSVGIFLFGAGRGTPVAISLPVLVVCLIYLLMPVNTARSETGLGRLLLLFNVFYWGHIASWFLFFPGLFILSFYQDIPLWLFLVAFASMPVTSFGSLVCGVVYDRHSAG